MMGPATNSIGDFYRDCNVFITGVTGFVGEALLEKLLRSCDGIGTIYVMVRPKRGVDSGERLKKLYDNSLFDYLKEFSPKSLEKVRAVFGNLEEPDLGLSAEDRRDIVENVSIVFHSAASVRFTDPLKSAVLTNTLATKQMVKLCKDIRNLKSFIYVSTAYSNTWDYIEEIVYNPDYDPQSIIDLVKHMPPHIVDLLEKRILGKHISTYTFTKSLAEKLVGQEMDGLPAAIVRLSIVNSAWKEPFPGWLHSRFSMTSIFEPTMLGAATIHWINPRAIIDLIPVDIVANAIIAAAWHVEINRSDSVQVYNCTSGEINGIIGRDLYNLSLKYMREYPTQHAVAHPNFTLVESKYAFLFAFFFNNYIPAFLYDRLLSFTGQKLSMVLICKKLLAMFRLTENAVRQDKRFGVSNFRRLMDAAKKAEDGYKFDLDMGKSSDFDWEGYLKDYILGIRRHNLKDEISTLSYAKTRMKRIRLVTDITKIAIFVGIVIVLLWWWRSC